MTSLNIPTPFTSPGCDLRDFAFMPLDVVRLRDSDIAALSNGDEFRCAVLLWCASWHQIPAASLPDDDAILSQLAGYGRVVKEWQKVRAGSLRGWIKCSDGRLYHPVVAEKANDAWEAKLQQRWKTECARLKKQCQRNKAPFNPPTFDEWLSLNCPQGQTDDVPRDASETSPDCPPGNAIQGTGIGTGIYLLPTDVGCEIGTRTGDTPSSGQVDIPVPADFTPDRTANLKAGELGLDATLEAERFTAHHQAQGTIRKDLAAWQAQYRKWLLDQAQFNADRNRVTDAKVKAATGKPNREDAIRAACDTIGVGSQYMQQEAGYAKFLGN